MFVLSVLQGLSGKGNGKTRPVLLHHPPAVREGSTALRRPAKAVVDAMCRLTCQELSASNDVVSFLQSSTLTKWLMTKVRCPQSVAFSAGASGARRGGGRAFHLGCTPDEADAGLIINLVNEVLLG